ncbi:MAG: alpha/beta hydrolase [Xanthomonadaceae bacterium]|nr:alpha/beta hydrolase [Xanthomonadaceae bacterium]
MRSLRLPGADLTLAAGESRIADTTDGIQVLFAHGFGQTHRAWTTSALALARHGFPNLAFDARGHGESDRNPPGLVYSWDQMIDDMIVLAGEVAHPPLLVGASMGGLIALMAEARWPGLFRAIVLVDVTPRWEQSGLERILAFMTACPEGFDSLDHAADVIAAFMPHRRERKSTRSLQSLLRQEADGRWRWHWDRRLVDELARDSAAHQDIIVEAARAVKCPLLLISGGRSELVSQRTTEEFRSLAPHAQHMHLPEATHMVAGDDNDAFTRSILEYLDRLPVPDSESAFAASSSLASPGAIP